MEYNYWNIDIFEGVYKVGCADELRINITPKNVSVKGMLESIECVRICDNDFASMDVHIVPYMKELPETVVVNEEENTLSIDLKFTVFGVLSGKRDYRISFVSDHTGDLECFADLKMLTERYVVHAHEPYLMCTKKIKTNRDVHYIDIPYIFLHETQLESAKIVNAFTDDTYIPHMSNVYEDRYMFKYVPKEGDYVVYNVSLRKKEKSSHKNIFIAETFSIVVFAALIGGVGFSAGYLYAKSRTGE